MSQGRGVGPARRAKSCLSVAHQASLGLWFGLPGVSQSGTEVSCGVTLDETVGHAEDTLRGSKSPPIGGCKVRHAACLGMWHDDGTVDCWWSLGGRGLRGLSGARSGRREAGTGL